jgi:hypothetical protein
MTKLSDHVHFKLIDGTQFPGNLEFYSTDSGDEFRKAGIFFLFFRGELIYIGFTNNHQDVIQERVVRQLATITLRDHRIQFTSAALDVLKNEPIFNTYFNLPAPVIANVDFVTSVNRVAFASYHWDEFINLNDDTLSRFEFKWYPNPSLGNHASIEALCNEMKKKYKPRCNQEYRQPSIE